MSREVDAAVIGSGFAGSLLAWILASRGVRVALIDTATHPRFAIGESSTPIADMILRRLGRIHQLPELVALSTWGSWQREYPGLACGRKRGFSYYVHSKGQTFGERQLGDKSLLVAASPSDEVADTHWYRPEVDQFLFRRAVQAGAVDLSGHAVEAIERKDGHRSTIRCAGQVDLSAKWLVDASGQAGVLARFLGAVDRSDKLQTSTHSVYAHYTGVKSWSAWLTENSSTNCDPFDADDAAQHHLTDNGWVWMLRFNNGITSVGFTAPMGQPLEWSGYRSLDWLVDGARMVAPNGGPRTTGRLQRWLDPVIDSRHLMLPTAAVTMDPLHSTGIAHALAGVDRLARIIMAGDDGGDRVEHYRRSVLEETRMLDQLVSTAYATLNDFPRFTIACMLYFAGAIRCEERYQIGEEPTHLWSADDSEFVDLVNWACGLLRNPAATDLQAEIRARLQPWNTAGLMDPTVQNRYAYTVKKFEV